ncbi:copper chaperone PCu(A)C [Asticcacaulis machinosus]|uniref:Copper chaperone PCu(A)C n=1 Tax=Asticcacaulis machinosus TaxID=2984211 RepID=A0ABT5HKQ4_9CAUL|nr:copper chaperone PCu(A)C [Asticcacaulis machinosus]MDC7676830.1 copper chaperone PCu(A)C [Asticcacaulis machinosus]
MKRFVILTMATLALTACEGQKPSETRATTVTKSTDIDGVKTHAALKLSAYGMRTPLGQNPNTGAYVTVENTGKTDDRLVSASCTCAARTELHTMSMADGQMSMSAVPEGFEIKAGEKLVLAPGGNHIMLFDLTTRPADGATQKVTLVFEKAGEVTIDMPVSMTPAAPAAH